MKAFSNNKIKVTEIMKFILEMVENVGKGKMLVTSIFFFPKIFSKYFIFKVVKSQDYVEKG